LLTEEGEEQRVQVLTQDASIMSWGQT
jgi:hypothetical protein